MQARELVRAAFSRIRVWHRGDPAGGDVFELEFSARGGGTLRARFDRASGGMVE